MPDLPGLGLVLDEDKIAHRELVLNLEHGMPFDRRAVLKRLGDDEEILKEIAALFVAGSPEMLDQIRQSMEAGDVLRLEKAAHLMKGSVSNFGAEEAVQAALHLEVMARTGDLTRARQAFGDLEKAVQAVQTALMQV